PPPHRGAEPGHHRAVPPHHQRRRERPELGARAMTMPAQTVAEPAVSPTLGLVLTRFRLRARRRTAWLRHLWGEAQEVTDGAALHGEIDALLSDCDAPEAEADWLEAEPAAAECAAELRAVEEALAEDATSRLARFRQIFGLTGEERDLFEACVAVAL